jgi:hypothetical protein
MASLAPIFDTGRRLTGSLLRDRLGHTGYIPMLRMNRMGLFQDMRITDEGLESWDKV